MNFNIAIVVMAAVAHVHKGMIRGFYDPFNLSQGLERMRGDDGSMNFESTVREVRVNAGPPK